jgi:PKHD-type hydroxylase
MNLKYYYWYFHSVISPKLCDDIIKHCSSNLKAAKIGGEADENDKPDRWWTEGKTIEKKRKSQVAFFDDRWIYKEIQPYVKLANNLAGWNFDWDWTEQAQFTKYGLNEHYGWHCDSYSEPYQDVPQGMVGKIRKLSVTVSLSDPEDYEGGDLEFDFRNNHDYDFTKTDNKEICKKAKVRGSIIVFPSFVWHRVTPVTSGTRYSMVMWNLGAPWR